MQLWGQLATASAAAAAIGGGLVGLIFRGAAVAWREERDAALEKAIRLETKVDDQDKQIEALERKVAELEKRTDYDEYASRSAREHQQILDALEALKRGLDANTTAIEFLIRQAFPTSVVPAIAPDQRTA